MSRRNATGLRSASANGAGQSRKEAPSEAGDEKRLVVTLGIEAGNATRRLASDLGISPSEAVRRGLTLLDLLASLGPDEELIVRNKMTGESDRLRFHWGY
jgi:hypothetical protein